MPIQNQTDQTLPQAKDQSVQIQSSKAALRTFAILAGIASITCLVIGILNQFWPLYLLAASFAVSCLFCLFTFSEIWQTPYSIKILFTTFFLDLSLIILGGVIDFAYGLPAGFIALFLSLLMAANNPNGWFNDWIIGFGLFSFLASSLLGILAPFPQITSLVSSILVTAAALVALFFFLRLLRRGAIITSIRTKLILVAIFLAITPLIILAFINIRSFTATLSQQSNETLSTAAKLTVSELDDFINSNLYSLENEASLPAFKSYLLLSTNSRKNSTEEIELAATLSSLQTKEVLYSPSYGILSAKGQNIYDTDQSKVGTSEAETDYFSKASSTKSSYASSVEFDPNSRESFLNFITPILSDQKAVLGYLRMTYDSRILQDELQKSTNLAGSRSYPILLDENGLRLADAANPDLIYHTIANLTADQYTKLAAANQIPAYYSQKEIASPIQEIYDQVFNQGVAPYTFFDVTTHNSTSSVLNSATFGKLTAEKWYVVYMEEQTSLLQSQQDVKRTSEIVAVIIACLVTLIITIFSTYVTQPIQDLTMRAQQISEGYLDAHVDVTSNDEIGQLGKSFNSMALQLKSSFENLDKRVRERTIEVDRQNEILRYRSRQLQTVTDVARIIVSKNDMESLLQLVTELISDRFNFYHAGIFLLDENNEFAVLRATNSTGGKRMLNRQHKLRIGQVGIVGYVTGTGNPRIATDVGKDAVYFNNPDLPDTKSEMALPLKIENKVIGALDIQSTASNAFTEDDIALFTTLADQISIAINNNRLLADTQKALEEAQNLHRQYLNQEWTRRGAEGGGSSYKFTSQGLSTYNEDLPEVNMVYESGRPITRSVTQDAKSGAVTSTLAVPILLRNEVIGVIHLSQSKGPSSFSESELLTVQTLADELAQTLEGARLFEQTIRRADRERRVLEITSKIRSTNDPQKMLEITLEELKRHLGVSQAQIVINMPGQTLPSEQTGSIHNSDGNEVQA